MYIDIKEQSGSNQLSLQTKGTPLPVTLGQSAEKQKMFTKEDSKLLQNERHFTDNDMRLVLLNMFILPWNQKIISLILILLIKIYYVGLLRQQHV